MNIELLVNNQYPLVLGDNISISLVRQNNFWREEADFGFEYSLPFDIPWHQVNAEQLGFPEDINARRRVTKNITLKIKNSQRMQGQLLVLNASYDGYTIALVRKAEYNLNQKLGEVVGATYPAPDIETEMPGQVAAGFSNGQDFNWPQIADTAESEMQKYPLNALWYWTYLNYYHGTAETFGADSPISPQFFLPPVVREVAKHYNWRIFSPWLSTPAIRNKMVFNTNGCDNSITPRYFKPVIYNGYGVVRTLIYIAVQTPYDGATYTKYSPNIGDELNFTLYTFNPNTLAASGTPTTVSYTIASGDIGNIPAFLANLYLAIQTVNPNWILYQTNTGIDNPGIWLRCEISGLSQILSSKNTISPGLEDIVDVTPNPLALFNLGIQMKNHLPDITVAEFFNALREGFNLAISFDLRTEQVFIAPKVDLLNYQTVDLTQYLLANPVTTEAELPRYSITYAVDEFKVYVMSDLSYEKQVTLLPSFLNPKETDTAINPAIGRPFCPAYGFPNGNGGLGPMPVTEFEIGNYTNLASNPFRLITWQGLQADTLGNDYPKADMEDLHPNELYETYYKAWVQYVTSDPRRLRARLNMPTEVLNTINPLHRWRLSGINHIWIEITETHTATDMEVEALLARI